MFNTIKFTIIANLLLINLFQVNSADFSGYDCKNCLYNGGKQCLNNLNYS